MPFLSFPIFLLYLFRRTVPIHSLFWTRRNSAVDTMMISHSNTYITWRRSSLMFDSFSHLSLQTLCPPSSRLTLRREMRSNNDFHFGCSIIKVQNKSRFLISPVCAVMHICNNIWCTYLRLPVMLCLYDYITYWDNTNHHWKLGDLWIWVILNCANDANFILHMCITK